MIGYPAVKINTKKYVEYVKNYGYFIAYYRFEEYNVILSFIQDNGQWSWRHFFRPYNYHTLTFMKKVLMLGSIPIFYEYLILPVVVLIILQAIDITRFLLTIPYHKFWRNLLYFTLEVLLLIFFVSSFINQYESLNIYDEDGIMVNNKFSNLYSLSGMIGIGVVFIYNILFTLSSFI